MAQCAVAIEQKKQTAHQFRVAGSAAVRGLVGAEVTCGERIGQRGSMLKEQTEAFAGGGIHRAGRIADERYIAATD